MYVSVRITMLEHKNVVFVFYVIKNICGSIFPYQGQLYILQIKIINDNFMTQYFFYQSNSENIA